MINFTRYILLSSFIFLSACYSENKKKNILQVALLRGPSAIAFSEWIKNPPVIEGKQTEITVMDSPELMHAFLLQNRAGIAILPMINAANLYNKSVEYQLIGCPVWGNLYMLERKNGATADSPLYIFGAGTTPDILTRYYCEMQNNHYRYNYTFNTPTELVQGIYAGKVNRAILAEPYLTMVLKKDTSLQITADLNNPGNNRQGFAQTAILIHNSLHNERKTIDSLIRSSCEYLQAFPAEAIQTLEQKDIFPAGMLTIESIERCRIYYKTTAEAEQNIRSFLEVIYQYEPKALGGKLPDEGFYK